jgi:hypothetical protein
MRTNFSFRNTADSAVINSGERKKIDTTVEIGKVESAKKYRYIAATKHIPLITNNIIVFRSNIETERTPFVNIISIPRDIIACIATISAVGRRSLITFISASFSGINEIPNTNSNIAFSACPSLSTISSIVNPLD